MKLDELRTQTLTRHNFTILVEEFGREIVLEEINDMVYHDLAYPALEYALMIGDQHAAHLAASVIDKSGCYGETAHKLARTTLGI